MVILDAGHGYNTKGKRSPVWSDGSQLFEWEFNRDVVKRIREGIIKTKVMTVDKSKEIVIPVWLLSLLVSVVMAGFTTWGIITANNAKVNIRLDHAERDIGQKVDQKQFDVFIKRLDRIEGKIDGLSKDR
jgi:hypothetical protein